MSWRVSIKLDTLKALGQFKLYSAKDIFSTGEMTKPDKVAQNTSLENIFFNL